MTDGAPKNLINDINTRPLRPLKPIAGPATAPTPRAVEHYNVVSHKKRPSRRPKTATILISLAVVLFIVSIAIGLNDWRINRANQKQVTALSKKTPSGAADTIVPSTVKPGASDINSYTVAPNMPRYLIIPELGVKARIKPLGVNSQNQLMVPTNVYDTGWYNASSLPGQAGAMLIDGHVSSLSTHGVFYGLKDLKIGYEVQIQRGDGKMFTYRVVKTQAYSSTNVDMAAATKPITAGQPGLNLITCTGQIKPGTYLFSQRLVVFTEQES